MSLLKRLEKFSENPWLDMVLGLIIFSTGVMESGDDFMADLTTGNFGAEHGVMLVGLGAQGWFDFALLGLTGVALIWGALRLARFVRDHGDEIGEARFDTRNKD